MTRVVSLACPWDRCTAGINPFFIFFSLIYFTPSVFEVLLIFLASSFYIYCVSRRVSMVEFWDAKCNLSQCNFDAILENCHIPTEVLPIRPNDGDLIRHPRRRRLVFIPRLFDYAQYRLPLTKFFFPAF